MATEATTVVLVDDAPEVRSLVRTHLRLSGRFTVVAEGGSGVEAIELAGTHRPSLMLLDVSMPHMDGLEATRTIVRRLPGTKIVVLTASDDLELGLVALRAGAVGFMSKTSPPESLPQALRAARAGEAVVSRRMTMALVDLVRRVREDGAGMRPVRSPLTAREWEVLDLLCEGETTDGVADALFLSDETVRSHVKNILRKLGVRSRQEAIGRAHEMRAELMTPRNGESR